MPRQFKATPSHPAVAYLVRLHADIGGQILENKREGLRLAENMKHVEHVIRLFDPDYNMRSISIRRRVTGNPWFKRGTMFRYALDALRTADKPMTVRQVTAAVMAARKIMDATPKQRTMLEATLRSCLEVNAKSGRNVECVDQGVPKLWKLI